MLQPRELLTQIHLIANDHIVAVTIKIVLNVQYRRIVEVPVKAIKFLSVKKKISCDFYLCKVLRKNRMKF